MGLHSNEISDNNNIHRCHLESGATKHRKQKKLRLQEYTKHHVYNADGPFIGFWCHSNGIHCCAGHRKPYKDKRRSRASQSIINLSAGHLDKNPESTACHFFLKMKLIYV